MMILGTIFFHAGHERFLYHVQYYTKEQRAEEINSFISNRKRLMKQRGAYYQIVPFIYEQKVILKVPIIIDVPKQEIERPPAVYNNLKTYEYK